MNFSTDRDLLAYEPAVFDEVTVASQTRVSVADAAVTGTTLTSVTADFAAAQVETGGVVLISDVAHEVIDRIDAHTLTISLPRTGLGDAAIPGAQGTALTLTAPTFAPQAAVMHDVLLALLGIAAPPLSESAGGASEGAGSPRLTEDDIISLSVMARLEALGTLERIYSSAVSQGGNNDVLLTKARDLDGRFRQALNRARIQVDLDGDGVADGGIQPAVMRLIRV